MTIINIPINRALLDIERINNLEQVMELSILNAMKTAYRQGYDIFWSNPINICREAGTNAIILFQRHIEMGQAIKAKDPYFIELAVPERWDVVFNQDGTVTITSKVIEITE